MTGLKRVVAICGSSRAGKKEGKSLTLRMLNCFLEGLAPPEYSIFYPHLMKVAYCTGCYACWFKTPGVCAIVDDMGIIRNAVERADLIILASPVYVDGFSAQTKIVLDRMLCTLDPFIALDREGHCRHHPLQARQQSAVLISCCGFSEADNFGPIREHFQAICRNLFWDNLGAVLLPASGLAYVPSRYDQKFAAIKKAGEEVAEKGEISIKTAEFISREVLSASEYRDFLNAFFNTLKK